MIERNRITLVIALSFFPEDEAQRAVSSCYLWNNLKWTSSFCLTSLICAWCSCRYERVTVDDGEDDAVEERTEISCVTQYQSSSLRVLTHFVADREVWGASEEDGLGQQNFLLGSDWQVDVTQLVKDSLRVADTKIAQLLEGQVLIGLSTGTTQLQVVCHHCFTSSFCLTSCSTSC